MKGKASIISNLAILAVGITMCLIFKRTDILRELVIIFGFIFLIPGIVELIYALSSAGRRQNQFVMMTGWISAIGGITLGAVMLLTPQSFTSYMVYIFSFGLVVASLNQLYVIGYAYRPLRFPAWFYLIPTLVLIAGVVIVASPMLRYNDSIIVLITGIGLILIGVLAFMEIISASWASRSAASSPAVPASDSKSAPTHVSEPSQKSSATAKTIEPDASENTPHEAPDNASTGK